jgi:hypothetical protein
MHRSSLTDKQYRNYEKLSRYSPFPLYYNKTDDKYIYGTSAYLKDTTPYILHIVKRGETFDTLALEYYNNPTLYWIICSFNRIQDPLTDLKEGDTIKIPSISSIEFDI